jgi:hypothetical protein
MVVLLGALSGPLGWGLFVPLGLLMNTGLAGGLMSIGADVGQSQYDSYKDQLKENFLGAQNAAFESKQVHFLRLMDRHLQKGGLLDENVLPYLGVIRPHLLKEASDQVAVTVLQARRLLAYARSTVKNAAGIKEVAAPLTFAALEFNPKREDHRRFLREKLEQTDIALAEDALPVFEEFNLPERRFSYQGVLKVCWRGFAAPYYLLRDRIDHRRALAVPEVPEVGVPPLLVEKDIVAILAHFESAHGRLDLPALRGWGARAALPAPQTVTPPRFDI